MAHIQLSDAQAWAESSKLNITALDVALEDAITTQVFAQLQYKFDTSNWSDETTTPALVRQVIAMQYVAWYYQRTYSQEPAASEYGNYLLAQASTILAGILGGTLVLGGNIVLSTYIDDTPDFEPNDATDLTGLIGPAFMMGQVF